jgi:hypothetical protein
VHGPKSRACVLARLASRLVCPSPRTVARGHRTDELRTHTSHARLRPAVARRKEGDAVISHIRPSAAARRNRLESSGACPFPLSPAPSHSPHLPPFSGATKRMARRDRDCRRGGTVGEKETGCLMHLQSAVEACDDGCTVRQTELRCCQNASEADAPIALAVVAAREGFLKRAVHSGAWGGGKGEGARLLLQQLRFANVYASCGCVVSVSNTSSRRRGCYRGKGHKRAALAAATGAAQDARSREATKGHTRGSCACRDDIRTLCGLHRGTNSARSNGI